MLAPWIRAGQQLRYTVADSIHTAPGWRILCDSGGVSDFHTCVEPVDRPMDPVWRREVHSFDPTAIFLWRKQLYLPPGQTQPVMVCHNALGRYVPVPNRELQLFYVEMPESAKHPRPNELLWVWEKFDDCLMYEGGPGAYMPWDGEIVRYLRADHNVMTPVNELARTIARRRAERKLRELKAKLEIALAQADFDNWVNRQLGKPGDTEQGFKEYTAKYNAQVAEQMELYRQHMDKLRDRLRVGWQPTRTPAALQGRQ